MRLLWVVHCVAFQLGYDGSVCVIGGGLVVVGALYYTYYTSHLLHVR